MFDFINEPSDIMQSILLLILGFGLYLLHKLIQKLGFLKDLESGIFIIAGIIIVIIGATFIS